MCCRACHAGVSEINPHSERCQGIEAALSYYARLRDQRESLPYEIDGVVFKVNLRALQEALGTRSRSPRWALAYKFEPKQAVTRVKEIAVQVGRTGALTPVALLEPVQVAGVEVSRASLHNPDEIARKDVRAGDWVMVQRAGDVIPEIVEVLKERRTGEEKPFEMPTRCPICGSAVVRLEDEVVPRCVGLSCAAKLKESIVHFASKRGMDIDGLGDKTVDQLVEHGLVKDIGDLYGLTKEDLLKLARLADKSAGNLIAAIERSKQTTLPRFLYALGIRHVGEHVADVLAREYSELASIAAGELRRVTEHPRDRATHRAKHCGLFPGRWESASAGKAPPRWRASDTAAAPGCGSSVAWQNAGVYRRTPSLYAR